MYTNTRYTLFHLIRISSFWTHPDGKIHVQYNVLYSVHMNVSALYNVHTILPTKLTKLQVIYCSWYISYLVAGRGAPRGSGYGSPPSRSGCAPTAD